MSGRTQLSALSRKAPLPKRLPYTRPLETAPHAVPDLPPRESAAQEAYEEAGIEGIVAPESIGAYPYVKGERKGGGGLRLPR